MFLEQSYTKYSPLTICNPLKVKEPVPEAKYIINTQVQLMFFSCYFLDKRGSVFMIHILAQTPYLITG